MADVTQAGLSKTELTGLHNKCRVWPSGTSWSRCSKISRGWLSFFCSASLFCFYFLLHSWASFSPWAGKDGEPAALYFFPASSGPLLPHLPVIPSRVSGLALAGLVQPGSAAAQASDLGAGKGWHCGVAGWHKCACYGNGPHMWSAYDLSLCLPSLPPQASNLGRQLFEKEPAMETEAPDSPLMP